MTTEDAGFGDSIARIPQRIASLLELLTTLDQRVLAALDGLEEMRGSMSTLDARLSSDLDEMRTSVRAKLDEVDVAALEKRLARLEQAIFNIEAATINLDRNFSGALESLPDFLTKRMKS
ncbi:MAG TPA: hypothetical protein VFK89_02605 [Actinomycetota bacterium]|nr:hypothetical protein [Actinomycetota bacterium]